MWSISILSGSWTMWPWWQAWDLSKGCPEGQSGSSSCYNILHAKSLLSPLSWTVNDHGHYKPLVLRNPGKEQPKKKKFSVANMCYCLWKRKHRWDQKPREQSQEDENSSPGLGINEETSFAPLGLTCYRPSQTCFQPPFLHWNAYMCLSHHIY